jgi:hypothetical protein
MDNFQEYAAEVAAIIGLVSAALTLAVAAREWREANKRPKGRRRMSVYRGIGHPAVAAVTCPYCRQAAGIPCVRKNYSRHGWRSGYVETHLARVKAYEKKVAARNA